MKVGQYKGRRIAVLTRDEHCPPHVHLDGGDWSARFEFSFWHNGVSLLDVIPDTARVPSQVKSDVIAIIKGRLPVARESWMEAIKKHVPGKSGVGRRKTVCCEAKSGGKDAG